MYHADQIFSKGQCWHKGCFKCSTCHRVLDSRIACDGPDNDIYCNGCYRKAFGLKGYGCGQGGPALRIQAKKIHLVIQVRQNQQCFAIDRGNLQSKVLLQYISACNYSNANSFFFFRFLFNWFEDSDWNLDGKWGPTILDTRRIVYKIIYKKRALENKQRKLQLEVDQMIWNFEEDRSERGWDKNEAFEMMIKMRNID